VVLPSFASTLLVAALTQSGSPPTTRVERETYLMGTTLSVGVVAVDRAAGIAAIESAFDAVRRVDDLLSTWRDDSEIARLNHAPPGVPVPLSADLYALLQEAARWSRETGGAFDPSVGALVDAWDLRGEGRVPSRTQLTAARAATGLRRFELNDTGATGLRRDSTAWLDTGNADALLQAGNFIQAIQARQGLKIACIEEIAYKMGYIDRLQLERLAEPLRKSGYGEYLHRLLSEEAGRR